jgi:hypothetical protein
METCEKHKTEVFPTGAVALKAAIPGGFGVEIFMYGFKTAMPVSGCKLMPGRNGFAWQDSNSCSVSTQELCIFSHISENMLWGGGGDLYKNIKYAVEQPYKYLINKSYRAHYVSGGFFCFLHLRRGKPAMFYLLFIH